MSQSTSGRRSLTTENHHSAYDAANSRLILAETARLIQAIGFAGHHLAVIGGLVPGVLVPVVDPDLPDHVGTQDIDLCLSIALTEGKVGNYDRIERCLKEANFKMACHRDGGRESWRWVGGKDKTVVVEFFCPAAPERPVGRLFRPGGVVGGKLSALALGTGDLIDADMVEREVEVDLPSGGGRVRLPLRVTGPAAYLAAKSDAINRRDKWKDSYDLIWLIQAWPGGTKALACEIHSSAISDRPEFQRAIDDLGNQFSDIDAIGTRRYAGFLASDERDLDADAQIAVGAMQELLAALQA